MQASLFFLYICGDFNARISNLDDFIAGVDSIPERNIVDFKSNRHGELLCYFLIDSNYCVLTGRNFRKKIIHFLVLKGHRW